MFKQKPVAGSCGMNMGDVNRPLLSLWKPNEIFGSAADGAGGNLKIANSPSHTLEKNIFVCCFF